ncbi:Transcription regulator [Lachnospiraceae bacterium TWA4]|nr:Transcription regulator [Lachnospiraceae bacterium TWA4]
MLNLDDLSQFVAFYNYGTLTKVAEEFNISQPTITRTMKRVEESFGVPLFIRSVNKIEMNDTGKVAAQAAMRLLETAHQCELEVKEYDRKVHTITVESCAPAPLWSFMPKLYMKHPEKTITSKLIEHPAQLEANLLAHKCHIGILPYPIENSEIQCIKYLEEHLSICVPPTHELAKYKEVSTKQINGYNCLLSSDIGFWTNFHKRALPSSKFFIQTDEYAFKELVKESTLPCFTTNLALDYYEDNLGNRISIPITDDEANVTYYICYWKNDLDL